MDRSHRQDLDETNYRDLTMIREPQAEALPELQIRPDHNGLMGSLTQQYYNTDSKRYRDQQNSAAAVNPFLTTPKPLGYSGIRPDMQRDLTSKAASDEKSIVKFKDQPAQLRYLLPPEREALREDSVKAPMSPKLDVSAHAENFADLSTFVPVGHIQSSVVKSSSHDVEVHSPQQPAQFTLNAKRNEDGNITYNDHSALLFEGPHDSDINHRLPLSSLNHRINTPQFQERQGEQAIGSKPIFGPFRQLPVLEDENCPEKSSPTALTAEIASLRQQLELREQQLASSQSLLQALSTQNQILERKSTHPLAVNLNKAKRIGAEVQSLKGQALELKQVTLTELAGFHQEMMANFTEMANQLTSRSKIEETPQFHEAVRIAVQEKQEKIKSQEQKIFQLRSEKQKQADRLSDSLDLVAGLQEEVEALHKIREAELENQIEKDNQIINLKKLVEKLEQEKEQRTEPKALPPRDLIDEEAAQKIEDLKFTIWKQEKEIKMLQEAENSEPNNAQEDAPTEEVKQEEEFPKPDAQANIGALSQGTPFQDSQPQQAPSTEQPQLKQESRVQVEVDELSHCSGTAKSTSSEDDEEGSYGDEDSSDDDESHPRKRRGGIKTITEAPNEEDEETALGKKSENSVSVEAALSEKTEKDEVPRPTSPPAEAQGEELKEDFQNLMAKFNSILADTSEPEAPSRNPDEACNEQSDQKLSIPSQAASKLPPQKTPKVIEIITNDDSSEDRGMLGKTSSGFKQGGSSLKSFKKQSEESEVEEMEEAPVEGVQHDPLSSSEKERSKQKIKVPSFSFNSKDDDEDEELKEESSEQPKFEAGPKIEKKAGDLLSVESRFSKGSSLKSENVKEEEISPASHNLSSNDHLQKNSLTQSSPENRRSLKKRRAPKNNPKVFPEADGLFKVPEESELLQKKFAKTPSSLPLKDQVSPQRQYRQPAADSPDQNSDTYRYFDIIESPEQSQEYREVPQTSEQKEDSMQRRQSPSPGKRINTGFGSNENSAEFPPKAFEDEEQLPHLMTITERTHEESVNNRSKEVSEVSFSSLLVEDLRNMISKNKQPSSGGRMANPLSPKNLTAAAPRHEGDEARFSTATQKMPQPTPEETEPDVLQSFFADNGYQPLRSGRKEPDTPKITVLRSEEARVPKPRDPSYGPNRISNLTDLTEVAGMNENFSDSDTSDSVPNQTATNNSAVEMRGSQMKQSKSYFKNESSLNDVSHHSSLYLLGNSLIQQQNSLLPVPTQLISIASSSENGDSRPPSNLRMNQSSGSLMQPQNLSNVQSNSFQVLALGEQSRVMDMSRSGVMLQQYFEPNDEDSDIL